MAGTLNIGGQEIPVIAIAAGIPVLAGLYLADMAYFGMVFPETSLIAMNDNLVAAEDEVQKKQGEAQELKQRTKEIDQVKQESAEYEKNITLLRSKIPGEAHVPTLLYDIERIARSSRGDVSSFTPGELRSFSGDSAGDIQEMPVAINASATFPQVIAFMKNLNQYERKLSVSNLTLTPTGGRPDANAVNPVFENKLNMTFTLNAYVLKGNEVAP